MSNAGLSKTVLGRLHDTMAAYVDRGELPGLVTFVSRRGEEFVDAIGTTAAGGGEPMRRDTIFRISSMTKPITAVAAMILVEECVLRLDDPVDGFLPELADRRVLRSMDSAVDDTVPAARPITLRDLLTFRMGHGLLLAPPGTYPIQAAIDELGLGQGPPAPDGPPDPDEWMRRLGTLPLLHQPGEAWRYHTGADVLGVLVSRASGQPFERFLRERVFEPLGMRDTGFSVPPAERHRLATSYATDPATGGLVLYDAPDGQWSRPPAFPSGGAGLVSTVDDYASFGQMLEAKGVAPSGERLLSRRSVELMTMDHLTPEQKARSAFAPGFWDAKGWGFGMSVVTRRTDVFTSVGAFGWDGGLGTSWWCDPTETMTTILLTQKAWTAPAPPTINHDFWTLAFAAIDD